MKLFGRKLIGYRNSRLVDQNNIFLIISGFNSRAILTLCRIFRQSGSSFRIIASGRDDSILHSEFAMEVIFCRLDIRLDRHFLAVLDDVTQEYKKVIICPTSEYLNIYLLSVRSSLGSKFVLPLVSKPMYETLSNKQTGIVVFCDSFCIHAPKAFDSVPDVFRIPFVAKPIKNIAHGKTHYPHIVKSAGQYERFLSAQDVNDFFYQEYIEGQSYYYCFYISKRTGKSAVFVQENLCQEPEGRSVLWAKKAEAVNDIVKSHVENLLKTLNFFGWIMIEVIRRNGKDYFIEANPRVWGPLQLAIDWCPEMGVLFIHDFTGKKPVLPSRPSQQYVWLKGLENQVDRVNDCRWYVPQPENFSALVESLAKFDVESHDANIVN